jgi:ferredoxin-NADP reductase
MIYYLGVLILLAAAGHLVFMLFQQFSRRRSHVQSVMLQRQILEHQVDEIIASSNVNQSREAQGWPGWRKFRLQKVISENASVKSFYFLAHDEKNLEPYLPGQHLTFRFKVPGHSKPVIRCYTLSDSSDNSYYRISVKKQIAPSNHDDAPDGLASCYLHDSLEVGDVVDVKSPSGKFFLDLTEKTPIVMIAGGIGLTPSLAMLNALNAESSERRVHLVYALQNKHEQIMTAQFENLQRGLPNLKIHRFFTQVDDHDLLVSDRRGYVSVQAMRELGFPFDADFYVCGPPPMMDSITSGLMEAGVHQKRIHFESFGPASVSKRRLDATQSQQSVSSHTVDFTISDKQASWSASQGSLLDLAESAGIEIESGCRAGSCGTCLTAIVEGEVTYIDEPGTEIEHGSCLACIAIPAGNLKLNA